MKLIEFLDELGSEKGAPGGGAAAALTGAAAAALIEMTARLNDKRHAQVSGSAAKAKVIRKQLLALIQKDARAFLAIQKNYKYRKTRPDVWRKVLKNGAGAPFEICQLCVSAATLALKEKNRTSSWLESDRKESLILLKAAFLAAELNIEINLNEITDAVFCKKMRKKINQWKQQIIKY